MLFRSIFSAYPGVRTKGTKNKIGLKEAFADRNTKGYTWNNLMLSKWLDHEGQEHRVLEDYERNKLLVDLHAQPDAIIEDLPFIKAEKIKDNEKTKFKLPSLDLLKTPTKKERDNSSKEETHDPEFLEKILLDFGVNGSIKKISHGPVVTLNEFEQLLKLI